ncbi:MAG TPA: SdpI family protein [Geobacteraceae bacterium]|nr:SdpI family protein [Geobacteraceae bacterium]
MLKHPFLIPSIIFFLLSIPLILGLVPPNRRYGIRTVKTLAEPKLWYSANRFGGWTLLFSSGIYLAMTLVSPSADRDFIFWLSHLAAFAIPLLVSLLLIQRYVSRL